MVFSEVGPQVPTSVHAVVLVHVHGSRGLAVR